MKKVPRYALLPLFFLQAAFAQPGAVLLVVNENSPVSRRIGAYYVSKRSIPLANVCRIKATVEETITRQAFERDVETPVARCLEDPETRERIRYIVTTLGMPLKVRAESDGAVRSSVDSELTVLYLKQRGVPLPREGMVKNPMFGRTSGALRGARFPYYLVTRLAGYDFEDVKGIIDRSLAARNLGKVVLDMKSDDTAEGNDWLREASRRLPKERVTLEESTAVLYDRRDVIGYASWGSNDPNRTRRQTGFGWLPGAIVTEFVSSDGRTFQRPPESWNIGRDWKNRAKWFAGSPQSLSADYIHEGATGSSGHVAEPYLGYTPRPEIVFPQYLSGRNLAESFYLSIPSLRWQNIFIGDPLCRLR
ncbi:MAG: TIGR03790 family protein [Bryobacteraceae bacterium]